MKKAVRGIFLCKNDLTLYVCGTPVRITSGEFNIITNLLVVPGHVRSRSTILDCLTNQKERDIRIIDTHIKRLRKKVKAQTSYTTIFVSHRYFGYSINPEWYNEEIKLRGSGSH